VPRLIFVNKLDRMGADPWACIEAARARLDLNAAAVQVNIGIENGLEGVVDLLTMKAFYFKGDNGEFIEIKDIPEDMVDFCKEKKLELIGTLADNDEQMEEYYLEENIDVPIDEIKKVIRK